MISSFKKKKRDGFTLVELLVVIAILAVLASVSVIGYLGFTKKAKVSNDVSLTTQMNRILQAEEAGGETFDTPHDAITALKEGGLDVTKLTPTTDGYNYVYDSNKHQMFLLDGSKAKIAPENIDITTDKSALYAFIGNENEISSWSDYSLYLKDNFVSDGTIDVTTGVDVGDNIVNQIIYNSDNNNKVIIRTSSASTNLTVNAPSGTIYHYGSTGCATLTEISDHSFWEYGKTAFVELTKGRIVLTEKSDVEIINVTATGNTYNNPIIADGGVKNENMPSMISRDAITVSGDSADLVQIQKLDSSGEVTATEQVKAYSNGTTGSTVKNETQNTDVNSTLGGIVLDTEAGKNALNETQKEAEKTNAVMEAESAESPKVEPVTNAVIYNSKSNKYYTETDSTKYESVLNTAISEAEAGQTLYLFTDITTTGVIKINKSIIFDGQGHTITSESTANYLDSNDNDKIIKVSDIESGVVTLRNVNLVADKVQYTGVRVENINGGNSGTNFTFNLNDVTIDVDNKSSSGKNGGYPIMIRETAKDIKVNLSNVVTKGWGAIQSTSEGVKLIANNCAFNTINYIDDGDLNNYYSAILASAYYKEFNETPNSGDNDFTFNNCEFTATHITKNEQKVADIRSPYNNVINFNGCKFTYTDPYYMQVCFTSYYGDRSDSSYDGSSRIYIDGVDVTYTADYILNYLDDSSAEDYVWTFYADPFAMLADMLGLDVSDATVDGNTTTWYVTDDGNYAIIVTYDDTAKTWTLTFEEVTE